MRLAYRNLLASYGIALLCVLTAGKLGLLFEPLFGDGFPFATMIVAVMISGWYGGFGPGVLTSFLGAIVLVCCVLSPQGWLSAKDVESQAGLASYLVVTVGMSAVCGLMRRALNRAEERTREAVRALESKLTVERNLNRTATQLERSDAFHRLITELTSDFTFRLNLVGGTPGLEYVSPGFTKIAGYSFEELNQTQAWRSLIYPQDMRVAERTIKLALNGLPDQSELRIVNRQGQLCWIRYLTQVQRSSTGDIEALVGAAEHVTEQRELEVDRQQLLTELAEKNAFIEAVLGQVPVGISVAEAQSGKLITANRTAQQITQLVCHTGQPIDQIIRDHKVTGWHDDGTPFEMGQWPMQRALRGEFVANEKVCFQGENGQKIYLAVNACPITDRDGRIMAAVSVFHDETERRQSEEQVLESQRFLRCSLDSLSSHIAVLDENGNILEVNEAWRKFATENNFSYFSYGVGSNYLAPFENQDIECGDGQTIARGIRNVMSGVSESFEFEYPCHSPEEQRWFLMRVTRFNLPGPIRVVVAHENVTKLREALDLLREADRRKDEFLATLAHELRNPLAPIRNAVQILKLPQCDDDSKRKTLDMVERQTSQLTRLVDDLLDVSRVMRGKIELRKQDVNIVDIIHQAIETAAPLLSSRHHELVSRLPSEPLPVFADPVRLSQVLSNLLTNAAKYTEPHGRIEVSAYLQDDQVLVRITDNGIGIAAHQLHGIFDLFMQVDQATTRAQGGLGIGLTLAKNLIELHAGSIGAESPGLGKGSIFTVRIPVAQHLEVHSPAQPAVLMATSPGSASCRVLVVDDNRDAANSLALLLRTLGHTVDVAHSGESALETMARHSPNIVFLDIGMPGMDGYEVARRVRADARHDGLCLVALTGWGQAEDRRRTAEAGFDHHIVKPPELPALLKVIQDSSSRLQQI